jgi:hypothetical protein
VVIHYAAFSRRLQVAKSAAAVANRSLPEDNRPVPARSPPFHPPETARSSARSHLDQPAAPTADHKKVPVMRIALGSARPSNPLRMSVWPVASQTRRFKTH